MATNVLKRLNAQIFVFRIIIKAPSTSLLRTRPVVEARLAVKGCHSERTAKQLAILKPAQVTPSRPVL